MSAHGFQFIDLFAGIGGIRQGFESAGGQCVFTSEWDRFAQVTYAANYDDAHEIAGDITKLSTDDIPDHDVLLGGFPCQPFSIAGVSKKNSLGRPHGFADLTQGTLFFDVARIISAKRPAAFLLENVKNLIRHDKGRTFATIQTVLREELGYEVHAKVINASPFVPQNRERILIAGFAEPTTFTWEDFAVPEIHPRMAAVLHSEDGSEGPEAPYTEGEFAKVSDRYVLSDKLWAYLQQYAAKHRAAGNGFGYGQVGPDDRARTLSARYHKDGSEILVARGEGLNPRRLTPRETARLMGYADSFVIPVSDTQAYRQFGNSVVVPVMREAARVMTPHVKRIVGATKAA